MSRHVLSTFGPLLAVVLFVPAALARADGGTVRLSEDKGSYRITVFTSPTPVRADPVDISVLVQDTKTGELASDVDVTIKIEGRSATHETLDRRATTEAATNKLYRAATFELSESGLYSVDVSVKGSREESRVRFEMEAADSLPSWMTVSPWVCWPVALIGLFAIHQVLVRRKPRSALRPTTGA